MRKKRVEFLSENFNFYFANECAEMEPTQRERLPMELLLKLFRSNGVFNVTSDRLPFTSKLFILSKALKKRFFLVIEDEKNGLSVEDFKEYKKSVSAKSPTLDEAFELKVEADFILANKELSESLAYVHDVATSPAYNFIAKSKNTAPSNINEWRRQLNSVFQMLSFYEANKKKWVREFGVTVPEWYVLTYISHGNPVVCSMIYKDIYKGAFNSSSTQISSAFRSLQRKGYIEKNGYSKGSTIRITALGSDIIQQVATKYILSF